MSADTVLVTGASGFVGAAVAQHAQQAGFAVRVTVRRTSPRGNIDGNGYEVVEADMRDADAMRRAMAGVRYVFHVAADYRLWAPDPREIIRTNVDGTRTVMDAALAAGVEKIVYTSSVATLRVKGAIGPVDETAKVDEHEAIGAYKRSKVAAERVVEDMIATRQLPAVIVHPSTPIGPRDIKPTPTGRLIVQAAAGKMPGYVDTGLNFVHVDDVAAGHLLALFKGPVGEHYILGGDDVKLGTLLQTIAGITGGKPPILQLPRWPLYPLAAAAEGLAKITKREPFVTVDGLNMSRYMMFFSSAKAQAKLGYTARPHRDALVDAIDWFREAGYLR
ncbi:hopanoid-associated sugar epimerase [Robbsia andropogonis]|uniref:hopanoid-associated sugar epimerase n=1 Tax=Robbsia andropogonis TaxID=28092 RepID=UPI0004653734|nr:hopanoid-associated sugar epimerase [Robbsia andropogonis]MCP1119462.1 NAD-dependent epimerase/dehydratase family protein [Robbsia andropogonis]MCP1129445.1 NAD-dependent epimerase/dehydratase family protein [Robbsia andropogonis]